MSWLTSYAEFEWTAWFFTKPFIKIFAAWIWCPDQWKDALPLHTRSPFMSQTNRKINSSRTLGTAKKSTAVKTAGELYDIPYETPLKHQQVTWNSPNDITERFWAHRQIDYFAISANTLSNAMHIKFGRRGNGEVSLRYTHKDEIPEGKEMMGGKSPWENSLWSYL